jgi:putative hemolysin
VKNFLPLILIVSFSVFAEEIYLLSDGKTKVEIPFQEIQKVLVNDVCSQDLKKCQALIVLNSKPLKSKLDIKKYGHQAAAYCKNKKGVPLNLLNQKGEGMSFCAFKDHSIISSWDLFRNHFPQRKKK